MIEVNVNGIVEKSGYLLAKKAEAMVAYEYLKGGRLTLDHRLG